MHARVVNEALQFHKNPNRISLDFVPEKSVSFLDWKDNDAS